MNAITFLFLISLAVLERLGMHLVDIVIACRYVLFNTNIYKKISEGFKMHVVYKSMDRILYSIKLQ